MTAKQEGRPFWGRGRARIWGKIDGEHDPVALAGSDAFRHGIESKPRLVRRLRHHLIHQGGPWPGREIVPTATDHPGGLAILEPSNGLEVCFQIIPP